MAAEEKLAYIQVGDEVGHYGAIKQLDGSRDTFYSTVIRTHEAADGYAGYLGYPFQKRALMMDLPFLFLCNFCIR